MAVGLEDRMAENINKLANDAKEVFIIGRTKYSKTKYIIKIGLTSDREYFDYFFYMSI